MQFAPESDATAQISEHGNAVTGFEEQANGATGGDSLDADPATQADPGVDIGAEADLGDLGATDFDGARFRDEAQAVGQHEQEADIFVGIPEAGILGGGEADEGAADVLGVASGAENAFELTAKTAVRVAAKLVEGEPADDGARDDRIETGAYDLGVDDHPSEASRGGHEPEDRRNEVPEGLTLLGPYRRLHPRP